MSTSAQSLTIWCNAHFTPPAMQLLRDGVDGHRLVLSSTPTGNLVSSAPDPELERAEVALGQPDPEQVIRLTNLRWVHLTSAGYTRYDRDDLRAALRSRSAVLTNSSAVYEEPCAEHCLAMMLAFARRLPQCLIEQQTNRAWRAAEHRIESRLMLGQSVVILGYGSIARRLVELLGPFRLDVTCVRRRPSGDEGVKVVADDRLDKVLRGADHVVSTLPETGRTIGMFHAGRFTVMKRGALFYNVGRGTTVDQAALLEALRGGLIGGAYLDVTDPEPLPPHHPLWSVPNCYITPHTAGGHHDEFERLVRHFLDNLRRFTEGVELRDRIV